MKLAEEVMVTSCQKKYGLLQQAAEKRILQGWEIYNFPGLGLLKLNQERKAFVRKALRLHHKDQRFQSRGRINQPQQVHSQ
jgi:hypothetical protein